MFDRKYLPLNKNTQFVLNHASLQHTCEMDLDSVVFKKQSDVINLKKKNTISIIHSVLFDRFFLSTKLTNYVTYQSEIILGNLSETFLTAIQCLLKICVSQVPSLCERRC